MHNLPFIHPSVCFPFFLFLLFPLKVPKLLHFTCTDTIVVLGLEIFFSFAGLWFLEGFDKSFVLNFEFLSIFQLSFIVTCHIVKDIEF